MHLIPTQDEVVRVLRETGALRDGHFEYPNGLHSNEYLQVPLAMRYYQHARTLSVGFSRLLRANSEIRAIIPELSIVAPATGGPAGGLRQFARPCAPSRCIGRRSAIRGGPLRFRQYLEQHPGEQVVLVDDILRSGSKLSEMKTLLESRGATVVGMAVVIYQPTPNTARLRQSCRCTTWPNWTPVITPTLPTANSASRACHWKRSGCSLGGSRRTSKKISHGWTRLHTDQKQRSRSAARAGTLPIAPGMPAPLRLGFTGFV